MKKYQSIVILLCCLHAFLFNSLQAQIIAKGELIKGKILNEQIKPREKHQYSIQLNKNQFSFIKLKQQGVDVTITTYDPDRKKIKEFNTLNGNNGPELITIVSNKKGKYMLEVSPLNDKEPKGNYELKVEKIEAIATTQEKQVDQLFSAWDNPETPGAAVAVVRNGKIIFKKGYGSANLEYNIPITSKTEFNICSVSKQFTAFAILLLAKKGKLSLNDDVRKYIPELPDFGTTITLRHLADHTSGLRDELELLGLTGWRYEDVLTNKQVLKLLSNQKSLNYKPGDNFLYINSGYFLLATVVERVTGLSFSEFTKLNMFEPLKMSDTRVFDDYKLVLKKLANSYSPDGNNFKKELIGDATIGSTNIYTNIEDLSLWASNFLTPKIGDTTLIDQMNAPGELNNGNKITWYAMGQDVRVYRGLRLYSHGGIEAGYRAFLGRFPDQKLSVIVLSNDESFDWDGMGLKVADIYLKDNISTVDKTNESKVQFISVDETVLKEYCGQYKLAPGMIIDITLEDGKLIGTAPGQSKLSLSAISLSEFSIQGVEGKVKFMKDNDGKVDNLILTLNGNNSYAKKIRFDATSIKLSEYIGDFYSSELGTLYSLKIEQNKLIAKHVRADNIELTPTKKDFFSGNQWFFGEIQFVRDDTNAVIGCKVSSGRDKNVWFDKLYQKSK